jgi:hypothetical protein
MVFSWGFPLRALPLIVALVQILQIRHFLRVLLYAARHAASYARGVTQAVAPESPPHRALLELPCTLENINAKMNHLIVRTEYGISALEKTAQTAERARELSEQARDAARRSGTYAARSVQNAGLPATQRLLAVAMGALVGGAAMSLIFQVVLAIAGATTLASCLGR